MASLKILKKTQRYAPLNRRTRTCTTRLKIHTKIARKCTAAPTEHRLRRRTCCGNRFLCRTAPCRSPAARRACGRARQRAVRQANPAACCGPWIKIITSRESIWRNPIAATPNTENESKSVWIVWCVSPPEPLGVCQE
jgi:hypothetical protein